MHTRSIHRFVGLALTLLIVAGNAVAQTFPSKPIRWIIPFPAGGTGDLLVRTVSVPMTNALQQNIVPDFRPGGAQIIGTELALRAPPDGHTLLFVSNSHTNNPAVRPSLLRYDTVKDFAGVARMATSPVIIVIHPSVPAKTVKDMVALARSRPGELTYGTMGSTGTHNLMMLALSLPERLKLQEVSYKGIAPIMMAVLGGEVAMAVTNLPDAVPYLDKGRLHALAVSSPKRSPAVPNVPTIAESGYPGFDRQIWMGAAMARAAPREAITRLGNEILRAMEQPEVHAALTKVGFIPAPLDPEKFDALINNELVRNAKIAREANLRAD